MNRVTIHFYAIMKYGINSNLNGTGVVSMKWCRVELKAAKLAIKPRSQIISKQADDIARYSDSIEDLETLSYFLLRQEMRALPRNIHQPVIKQCLGNCLEQE